MNRLPARDIVLIGAGHTNLHIVVQWASKPIHDTRLTVVSPTRWATYSGMLPGTLAGLYQPRDMLIDLHRLTQAAGVRLIVSPAERLDPDARRIHLRDRPPVRYDYASIGIGSVPAGLTVAEQHQGLVAVKPMFTFLARLEATLSQLDSDPVTVAVVGAGAAGVEIAFCVRQYLMRAQRRFRLMLVDAHESILRGFRERTQRIAVDELRKRDIEILTQRRVTGSSDRSIRFENEPDLECDLLLWCVGAAPAPLLKQTGLPLSDRGFLAVDSCLKSTSGHSVFAVGDSSEMIGTPLPRAGVYAVRQGPVLLKNLRRATAGRALKPYRPQTDFLRLLATGDGSAIGQYRRFAWCSPWLWKLKDKIDTRFMDMHRPESNRMLQMDMSQPMPTREDTGEQDGPEMRCQGCGGKTSARVLENVLSRLKKDAPGSDRTGFLQFGDSAALPESDSPANTVSVDFFQSFMDDPWTVGRIAAIHAMSDLWAAGATPQSALAMITLPAGPRRQQEQMLEHLMRGALHEFHRANVVLLGGHTVDGDDLSIGFTILGHATPDESFHKSRLSPDDQLILTKPVGTGAILAAAMQNRTDAHSIGAAIDAMLHSNESAARVAHQFGVSAVTDVTGFGVAGHLFEMLESSGVSATVSLNEIPLIEGAAACFESGVRSSLDPENRAVEARIQGNESSRNRPSYHALFDPQTSGGPLIGVARNSSEALLSELKVAGWTDAAIVGHVMLADGISQLVLRDTEVLNQSDS